VERFKPRKVNDVEVKEQYQVKIYWSLALENLDDDDDDDDVNINIAWKNIRI